MGKSSINGQFSMAMLNSQRVTDAPVEDFQWDDPPGRSSTGCFIVHTDSSFGSLIASHCLRSISRG